MSGTAFAPLDNSIRDSSSAYGNLDVPSPHYQLLQEGQERVKQHRSSTLRGTEFAETKVMNPSTFRSIDSNVDAIIKLSYPTDVPQARPVVNFLALQEWEGYVLEKGEDEFTARLLDLTAGSLQEEEEATIPLEEIAEDDFKRLIPGSIFRWVIGYERSPGGTKRRVSQIVFRDLPVVSESDMTEGMEWARKVAQLWSD